MFPNNQLPPFLGRGELFNVPYMIYPRYNRSFLSNIEKYSAPKQINLSKILNSTQRGINTINQIIPIYKQVKPIYAQFISWSSSILGFIGGESVKNTQNKYQNKSFSTRTNQTDSSPFFY